MRNDEFLRVCHEEALNTDMPEWPRLTEAQRTHVAGYCISGAVMGYEALLDMLSERNSAAYADALDDLGFAKLAQLVRGLLQLDAERMADSDEFFELAVELKLQERAILNAVDRHAKDNRLFPCAQ